MNRVRDAHAERKARGIRHGRPELPEHIRQRISAERRRGETLVAIANRLNDELVPTARGGTWRASTISHVLKSVALDEVAA